MKTLAVVLFAVGCQTEAPVVVALADAPVAAAARAQAVAPWRLTASDGSGLMLTGVDARAVVQGPLAFTELHLAYHNGENRIREGTFAIDLPAGAQVSRFAMEGDTGWLEAEVVPKALGRIAYDDALHARKDPALLERGAGNSFTAKVFPIPARADKHIVIAFSQPLRGEAYALPLRGLPRTERVAVTLNGSVQLDHRNWAPDRDFVAPVQTARAAVADGMIAAVVTLPRDAAPVALDEVSVLVDTSASRALDFAAYVEQVRSAIAALPAKRVQVIAFDQDSEVLYDGAPQGFGVEALVQRGAAGATDLAQALARPLLDRVVVITDGVRTLGELPKPDRRIDVVLAGGSRDEGLDLGGSVLDLARDDLARELRLAAPARVAIEVAGATWSYPRTGRAGDTVMVYARAPAGATIAGQQLATTAASSELLERAVAGAEIAELEDRHDPALAQEIETRSLAARVMSSQTSMIVLERDTDYARYGIERTADKEVLVVDDSGRLRMTKRKRVFLATAPTKATPRTPAEWSRKQAAEQARTASVLGTSAVGGSFASLTGTGDISSGFDDVNVYGGLLGNEVGEMPGAAGLGRTGFGPGGGGTGDSTIGTGRYGTIGHGTGAGYGRGGMRARTGTSTRVDVRVSDISAGLDGAIVRRYLKRSSTQLAACQERFGGAGSELRFAIGPDGKIRGAHATGAGPLAGCLEKAVAAIELPRPEDGAVVDARATLAFTLGPAAPAAYDGPRDRGTDALTGKLAEVMRALRRGDLPAAEQIATAWHERDPTDVLGIIAMGEVYESNKRTEKAVRMYGSIIDLYPTRAEMLRFAGERLLRTGALSIAVSAFRTAVSDRPDHLTGHRLLAYALLRSGDDAGALAAIRAGLAQAYPAGRFVGGERILGEDLGMIAAHMRAHGEAVPAEVESLTQPSTRFVLSWETDGNDVDFHIRDAKGNHAWFSHKQLASGGELYADVTTGFGPECFAIPGTPTAGPYALSLNYFAQGPEGYGMGVLEVQRFDGRDFTFDDRPFVIMQDHAFVDLGTL